MFGYACDETPELMPLPIHLAHRLVERQAEVRKNGRLPWLRPDAKSQVTMRIRRWQAGPSDRHRRPLDAARARTVRSRQEEGLVHEKRVIEKIIKPCCRKEWSTTRHLPHQPDRPLRHRRPARRLRPDRPQDHRRHLRRPRPPRRRRLLRQGSVQGRPLGRLHGAATSPRTSSPPAWRTAARSSSPTRSAWPIR